MYEEEAAYFYEDTSDRIMDDDVLARLLAQQCRHDLPSGVLHVALMI